MSEVIRTVNLTKVYGQVRAVDNLNLSVKRGEIFAFLGPNGAGKTTTIRMLLGMVAPTRGSCYLQGKKVSAGSTGLWNDVGYMVERPSAYPELTVKENLEIVRLLRGIKDKSCVEAILEKLKLAPYASTRAGHLSTGNLQRLGIAKALIHRPQILILDEPTNGLDPAGIIEVRRLLQDLAANFGVTILVSSHRLDEIARLATQLAIIHRGKLIKGLDRESLNRELKRALVIGGKNQDAMRTTLAKAGYGVELAKDFLPYSGPVLLIKDSEALERPEAVVSLLVKAGCPPNLVKVEREELEAYFIRTIREAGGNI
jgi:ABC-2 type transport system ATP-binding protein